MSNNNQYQDHKGQRALFGVLKTAIQETQIWVRSGKRKSQGLIKTKAIRLISCLERVVIDSDAGKEIFVFKE